MNTETQSLFKDSAFHPRFILQPKDQVLNKDPREKFAPSRLYANIHSTYNALLKAPRSKHAVSVCHQNNSFVWNIAKN